MGSTPSKAQLMTAAIEKYDIDRVKMILKDLTDEEKYAMCKTLVPGNINRCTIFHYAVWQDHQDLLELLLDYVDDLEIRDALGWTPLSTAVSRDSKENVKILLERGAKIDCDYIQGMNLIAIAMSFNDPELIEILMDHGAQVTYIPDSDTKEENPTGCYLLHFAIDDGLFDIVKLLVKKGRIPLNTLNQTGWSPLHIATKRRYLNIVKLLLENGADVNIKDHDGNTPLALAKHINAEDIIQELEKHGGRADKAWYKVKSELNGIDNTQFEIEDSSLSDKKPIILDALQRQH